MPAGARGAATACRILPGARRRAVVAHWSDAPFRADRAGHNREYDSNRGNYVLDKPQTDTVRMNVMWVVAQVLGYNDPNFNKYEFAEA
jgi:hypothetical protein